jgi:hypothetical protein
VCCAFQLRIVELLRDDESDPVNLQQLDDEKKRLEDMLPPEIPVKQKRKERAKKNEEESDDSDKENNMPTPKRARKGKKPKKPLQ